MIRPPAACCPPPAQGLTASPDHVAALKALAHLGRLKVFFHLVQATEPQPVGDIQAALRLPAPTLSHHLEHLERAGLITRRKQDRFIYSEVRRDTVTDLVRLLTACC
jgi:ArsR family transcriptional regulator